MLWGCFSAGGTGAPHQIDGIMKKEDDVEILKQHQDISQEVWVKWVIPLLPIEFVSK